MARQIFVSCLKFSAPVMTSDSRDTQRKRRGYVVAPPPQKKHGAYEHICHILCDESSTRVIFRM